MSKRASARKPKEPGKHIPAEKRVVETFFPIDGYELRRLEQSHPSSFNGWVRVRRYRITIEEIEEPDEVIAARIQELWDTCDNYHHVGPLRSAAARVGLKLEFPYGSKRPKAEPKSE